MKTFIILLSSCLFCLGLSASEATDDHKFKEFINHIDMSDTEARLPYLIDMQQRSDMNNPSLTRYFSVQLAVELEVLEKTLERRIKNIVDCVRQLKEQIYNSPNADEIKSCLSLIDDIEKQKEDSVVQIEYIDVLREKYCPWLKNL